MSLVLKQRNLEIHPSSRNLNILDFIISSIKDDYGNITNFDCSYISLYNIGFPIKHLKDLIKTVKPSQKKTGISKHGFENMIKAYNKVNENKDGFKPLKLSPNFTKQAEHKNNFEFLRSILQDSIRNNELRCILLITKNNYGHIILAGFINNQFSILDSQDIDNKIKKKYLFIGEEECSEYFLWHSGSNNNLESIYRVDGGFEAWLFNPINEKVNFLSRRSIHLEDTKKLGDFTGILLNENETKGSELLYRLKYFKYPKEQYTQYIIRNDNLKIIRIPSDFVHIGSFNFTSYVALDSVNNKHTSAFILDIPKNKKAGDLIFIKKNFFRIPAILNYIISPEFKHLIENNKIVPSKQFRQFISNILEFDKNIESKYSNKSEKTNQMNYSKEIESNFEKYFGNMPIVLLRSMETKIYVNPQNTCHSLGNNLINDKILMNLDKSLLITLVYNIFVYFQKYRNQNEYIDLNKYYRNSKAVYFDYWIMDPFYHIREDPQIFLSKFSEKKSANIPLKTPTHLKSTDTESYSADTESISVTRGRLGQELETLHLLPESQSENYSDKASSHPNVSAVPHLESMNTIPEEKLIGPLDPNQLKKLESLFSTDSDNSSLDDSDRKLPSTNKDDDSDNSSLDDSDRKLPSTNKDDDSDVIMEDVRIDSSQDGGKPRRITLKNKSKKTSKYFIKYFKKKSLKKKKYKRKSGKNNKKSLKYKHKR